MKTLLIRCTSKTGTRLHFRVVLRFHASLLVNSPRRDGAGEAKKTTYATLREKRPDGGRNLGMYGTDGGVIASSQPEGLRNRPELGIV